MTGCERALVGKETTNRNGSLVVMFAPVVGGGFVGDSLRSFAGGTEHPARCRAIPAQAKGTKQRVMERDRPRGKVKGKPDVIRPASGGPKRERGLT